MTKGVKIIIGLGALVGIAWVVRKAMKGGSDMAYGGSTDGSSQGNPQTQNGNTPVFPLKKGSKGNEVKNIQRLINLKTSPIMIKLKEDGVWGDNTEKQAMSVLKTNSISESKYKELLKDPSYVAKYGF